MKYTVDIIAIIITLSISVPMIAPMIDTVCMEDGAIEAYEKITMAGIAILAGYVGGTVRSNIESKK